MVRISPKIIYIVAQKKNKRFLNFKKTALIVYCKKEKIKVLKKQ